jgi:hypothetical protein
MIPKRKKNPKQKNWLVHMGGGLTLLNDVLYMEDFLW